LTLSSILGPKKMVESPFVVIAGTGATINLFRLAVDLIVHASNKDEKDDAKTTKQNSVANGGGKYDTIKPDDSSAGASTAGTETTSLFADEENTPIDIVVEDKDVPKNEFLAQLEGSMFCISLSIHTFLFGIFGLATFVAAKRSSFVPGFSVGQLGCSASAMLLGIIINYRDRNRTRFSSVQRVLYISSAIVLLLSAIESLVRSPSELSFWDYLTLIGLLTYTTLAIAESKICSFPISQQIEKKAKLSRKALFILLKPYIWPDATNSSAALNRFLAMMTWVFVIATKITNLIAPMFLGKATTALSQHDYTKCIEYVFAFASLQFASKICGEGQRLVYLKVAQAAFIQLAEATFQHLHSLSLDWHLQKKLGEVIRSMDRGISACDTLMKYLFLWLVPAMGECIVVLVIFATYFRYFPLSVSVFFFVFVYVVMTIILTLWRKKFRKAVAKSDNDWHDICTDSLINFETVKFFSAEDYEIKRFGSSVTTYQKGAVNVTASMSMLNMLQQIMFQLCLATTLSLAAMGIKQRADCCVSAGCDIYHTTCCSTINQSQCPGLDVGDFVAVLSYTINLFAPLNYLGSIYNAIVMAMIDLANLSELLAEDPDLIDAPDAISLPLSNSSDGTVAVEFDNVYFHYPSQAENCGLKGMSFVMKKGTVTAIVGSTGAGKTTVSRLLFRFYDVLGGAVKVNGMDVRAVSQKSLRDAIGVVPQTTTLFNDTIKANVMYGRRDATQEELDQVARDSQLDGFISSLPDGWNSMVGDRGLKLSGGEKQRVSIARCLLKNPSFVVLDEATSALDTITENSVQDALDRLGEDRTCLVIAHRLGTIRNADNIVVLNEGAVAEQGTHEELLELDGKYAELWNMQIHSTSNSNLKN